MDEWYYKPLEQLFWASTGHFLLGCVLGASVYSLISTILLRWQQELNMGDSSIHIISLLVSLSLAVVVHILQDFYLQRF